MPSPGAHVPKFDPPASDNEYFERMCRVIFTAGLNWATLDQKWSGIKQAFHGFEIDAVAAMGEAEIEELMKNPAVIRNRAKIQAIITDAREFQAVIDEYGSLSKYLDSLRPQGEAAMRAAFIKRFAFMGPGTASIYLLHLGEDQPEAAAKWQAHHRSR